MEEKPVLQVIIVDFNVTLWKFRSSVSTSTTLSFDDFVRAVTLYCSMHIAMNRDNMLSVISSGVPDSSVLFPSEVNIQNSSLDAYIPNPATVTSDLVHSLMACLSSVSGGSVMDNSSSRDRSLAQALSQALCVINRRKIITPQVESKILVFQLSPDLPDTYNSLMNCIFSAQKFGVPVDSVVMREQDSSFLQQASFLTGGVYQRLADEHSLLQMLATHILPSPSCRLHLRSPVQRSVDFKASCSCHDKQVEFTYMCSVCLSLTCSISSACETCGTPMRGGAQRV